MKIRKQFIFTSLIIGLYVVVAVLLFREDPYEDEHRGPSNSKLVQRLNSLRNTADQWRVAYQDNGVEVFPIPVLVMACNRPEALQRVLEQIHQHRTSANEFPVIVSQDCEDSATANVAKHFNVTHLQQPDQSILKPPQRVVRYNLEGYLRVSRHYRWALNKVLNELPQFNISETLIIIEDDLDLSPDIFTYFKAMRRLLLEDETLLCASAYNDNGKADNVNLRESCRLWRTDFFPGLGWMATTTVLRELLQKWPHEFWDDWLRQPQQRNGRACIRPEVSKTKTFGKVGVSQGQYFERHLATIVLNKEKCIYDNSIVDSLKKDQYFRPFMDAVFDGTKVISADDLDQLNEGERVILEYNKGNFKATAALLNIMDDVRGGLLRNTYYGVVPIMYNGARVYLMPRK